MAYTHNLVMSAGDLCKNSPLSLVIAPFARLLQSTSSDRKPKPSLSILRRRRFIHTFHFYCYARGSKKEQKKNSFFLSLSFMTRR